MKRHSVKKSLGNALDQWLSGQLFTWQQIRNLLIPSVLDCMSITLINMLITALISKNGPASVAAVSLVGPITGLAMCFFQGLSDGGSVIVAQCCGKKDSLMLKHSIGMIFWLNMLTCAFFCIPFILFAGGIIGMLYPEIENDVAQKACIYLAGCGVSLPIYALYSVAFRILRGMGESTRCLFLSVLINMAYLVFSILFINILHMDILGSVLALLTARIIGVSFAIAALFFWKPPVRMKLHEFLCYDPTVLRATCKISFPFALELICANAGSLVFQMFMSGLGTVAIATHAIAHSMLGVLYSPASAMSNVSVALVGRCVGANNTEEAFHYGKRCNQLALVLLILSALVFYPLLPFLLAQYNATADAEIMIRYLLLATLPFLLLFWTRYNTLPSTLRACGDSLFPTVVSMSVLWAVNIGLGYLLSIHFGLGLWGIWFATWAGWFIQGVILAMRFHSRKWADIQLLNGKQQN